MKKIIKKLFKKFGYEIIRRQQAQVDFESLLSLLFYKTPEDLFFIQIGANDGRKNDPICDFVSKYKLSGLLVEPQKNVFERLRQNYSGNHNLIYENAAISDTDGYKPIYMIKKSFQDTYEKHTGGNATGMTSFNKDHVREFIKKGMESFFKDKDVDDYIEELRVKTVTFDTLINNHNIKNIDLLQIDTEGFDYEVIKMIDFDKYPPKLINYESVHLSINDRVDCESFLAKRGYLLIRNRENTTALMAD